jgi:hypothetical protein
MIKLLQLAILGSLFIYGNIISLAYADDTVEYTFSDVSFEYPASLAIENQTIEEGPLTVSFTHGKPPFSINVIFKEISNVTDIPSLIKQERQEQDNGGYRDQVQENTFNIQDNIDGVEFVRTTKYGAMYYFAFPSTKEKKLYSFRHMTSDMADPDRKALEAYHIMKNGLVIK